MGYDIHLRHQDFRISRERAALDDWLWRRQFEPRWEAGAIDRLGFIGDRMGRQDQALEALAPFVEAGSWLPWQGEEGEYWRSEFDGRAMRTVEGRGPRG